MASSESAGNLANQTLVETWLRASFEKVRTIPPNEHVAWGFEAADSKGNSLLVMRPLMYSDQLQITGGLTFLEQHKQRFSLLDRKERHRFVRELALELYQFGVQFDGLDDPPQNISVHSVLYWEQLTRNEFAERCLRVGNAVQFIKHSFLLAIDEPFAKESFTIN